MTCNSAEARLHTKKAEQAEYQVDCSENALQEAKQAGETGYARCKDGSPTVITSSVYHLYAAGLAKP